MSKPERTFFEGAGVQSFDDAHKLVLATFSPGATNVEWSSPERRRALSAALRPRVTDRYKKAVARWGSHGRYPTGAAGPSEALQDRAPRDQSSSTLVQAKPIDLVGQNRYELWPAEDQRPRQTCVAFAAAACIELYRALQGAGLRLLSPQYLYWHMRTHKWPGASPPGWEEGATKLGYAKEVLADNGICSLEACPYVAGLQPLEGPRPTEAAEAQASENRVPDIEYYDYSDPETRPPGLAQRVYQLLAAEHRPVAISFPVFNLIPGSSLTTLDNPQTDASGELLTPPRGSAVSSGAAAANTPGHAACIIGFQPDREDAAGGWFIFRNSFGLGWADSIDPDRSTPSIPARGYGAIPASYVEDYCWEIFSPRS